MLTFAARFAAALAAVLAYHAVAAGVDMARERWRDAQHRKVEAEIEAWYRRGRDDAY